MKHLLLCSISSIFLIFGSFNTAFGKPGKDLGKDSIPSNILAKARITVKDLADGKALDSVLITVGSRNVYTDANGYIELDSVVKESLFTASKNGYLLSSKKIKSQVNVRLIKRETVSPSLFNNGLYQRPADHFSGS